MINPTTISPLATFILRVIIYKENVSWLTFLFVYCSGRFIAWLTPLSWYLFPRYLLWDNLWSVLSTASSPNCFRNLFDVDIIQRSFSHWHYLILASITSSLCILSTSCLCSVFVLSTCPNMTSTRSSCIYRLVRSLPYWHWFQ